MSSFLKHRPSPALIISIIALVAAAGGTALASGPIGSGATKKHPDASADKKTFNRLAPNASVKFARFAGAANTATSANTAGASNTANTANAANTANTAGNANNLGGLPPSAYQSTSTLLFAAVDTNATTATVVRGRGATGAGRIGTGNYFVSFTRPIANCIWLATAGRSNDGAAGSFFATVEGRDFAGSPNDVEVRIWSDAGTPTDGPSFHLQVICP